MRKVYFWRRILLKAFKKIRLSEKENNFEELIVKIVLLLCSIERLFMIKLTISKLLVLFQ